MYLKKFIQSTFFQETLKKINCIDVTIGDRILKIAAYYKLSQAQLAEKIKVSEGAISKAITGVSPPGAKVILNVLAAFPEINADWFVRGRGQIVLEKNKLSYFQEDQAAYLTQQDLYNFHKLVKKVEELDQIVKELQKNIK